MPQTTSYSQHYHAAVIAASDNQEIVARLRRSFAQRRAGECMATIADMHRRGDYNPALSRQLANDAIGDLPFGLLDRLTADFLGENEPVSAAELNRLLDEMRAA